MRNIIILLFLLTSVNACAQNNYSPAPLTDFTSPESLTVLNDKLTNLDSRLSQLSSTGNSSFSNTINANFSVTNASATGANPIFSVGGYVADAGAEQKVNYQMIDKGAGSGAYFKVSGNLTHPVEGYFFDEFNVLARQTRNVLDDLSDGNNYPFVTLLPQSWNNNATGIGFGVTSTSDGSVVGAAIYHTREGSNSYGSLSFATKNSSGTIAERVKITSSGNLTVNLGGSANKAICWKSDGKTLGYCSTIVGADGSCTCN